MNQTVEDLTDNGVTNDDRKTTVKKEYSKKYGFSVFQMTTRVAGDAAGDDSVIVDAVALDGRHSWHSANDILTKTVRPVQKSCHKTNS
jgi:hypothetical protein